mgnify:CR=1 FL=1
MVVNSWKKQTANKKTNATNERYVRSLYAEFLIMSCPFAFTSVAEFRLGYSVMYNRPAASRLVIPSTQNNKL